jgi:hypothetical protein
MRRSSGVWTSFSSADLMERLARKRWERRREVAVLILGALLGAALSVGVGALLLGRLSRRSVPGVAAHIVAGSLLALPPTLLVLAVNPLVEPWDQYGIAAMFFIMGCLGAVALAAMGSFGFASWRRPAPALAAAVMGSITGITAAIFADGGLYRMIDDLPFETVSFRWAVAAGLVGLFAAIGCQLSGGPRPAADQNAAQRTP